MLSESWVEQEFHCLKTKANDVAVAYWTGEPGRVWIEPWPCTEVCLIMKGRVAVADSDGGRREFGPGDGFIVHKGSVGEWITLEVSAKIFVAVE